LKRKAINPYQIPHYQHTQIGYNYRLSNVSAGIGRGQLQVLKDRVAQRRHNYHYYHQHLSHLPGLTFMPEADYGTPTHWLTPVWKPMHLQPIFQKYAAIGGEIAANLFDRGLCLPSGSNLTNAELDRVITAIIACHQE
jgi:dTDP-4-amino-4,6-dideoxygalactose transaminase